MTSCVVRVVTAWFLLQGRGGRREKVVRSVGWRVLGDATVRVLCELNRESTGGSLLGD